MHICRWVNVSDAFNMGFIAPSYKIVPADYTDEEGNSPVLGLEYLDIGHNYGKESIWFNTHPVPWRSAQKASIRLRTCSNVPYHIKLVLDDDKCQEYPIVPQMETGIKRTLWDVNIDLAR